MGDCGNSKRPCTSFLVGDSIEPTVTTTATLPLPPSPEKKKKKEQPPPIPMQADHAPAKR
jgi:hypothetical protein